MPVDFDSYAPDESRITLTEGTNASEIMSFLLEHPGVGFAPSELHERTGVARGSINPTLARLESAGLVRHKGDYWAVAEDDRLAAASAAVLGVQSVESSTDDWYSENDEWVEDTPDLSEQEEDR